VIVDELEFDVAVSERLLPRQGATYTGGASLSGTVTSPLRVVAYRGVDVHVRFKIVILHPKTA
jgi:hypothetical protein